MAEFIEIEDAREAAAEPKFGVRPFRATDIAPMVRIIGKIGLKEFSRIVSPENVKALMGKTEDGELRMNVVGVGIALEIASVVCENFDKAEGDLFALMASLSGLKVKDVEELSLADTFDMLYAIFTAKDFSDFFKRVRSLLK